MGVQEVDLGENETIVGGIKVNIGFRGHDSTAAAGGFKVPSSVSTDAVRDGDSVSRGRSVTFTLPDDLLSDEEIVEKSNDVSNLFFLSYVMFTY